MLTETPLQGDITTVSIVAATTTTAAITFNSGARIVFDGLLLFEALADVGIAFTIGYHTRATFDTLTTTLTSTKSETKVIQEFMKKMQGPVRFLAMRMSQ